MFQVTEIVRFLLERGLRFRDLTYRPPEPWALLAILIRRFVGWALQRPQAKSAEVR
jgi:hypothetical protein